MTRLRILVFIHHYLPGFRGGGPAVSVSNLVDRLGDQIDFWIVTSDRDFGASKRYAGVDPNSWVSVGRASVRYVRDSSMNVRTAVRIIATVKPQIIYFNSLFDTRSTLIPMMYLLTKRCYRYRIVLAPRGELHPGALRVKSWRKRLFLLVLQLSKVPRLINWHATNRNEHLHIVRGVASASHVHIAPNIPSRVMISSDSLSKHRPELRAVFLSRISRKKNLRFAIEVLARAQPDWELDVYGPIEDQAYWDECLSCAARLGVTDRVRYLGEVQHADVHSVLSVYSTFFFPSLGENYGHVVYEALSAGCFVLTSVGVPWPQLDTMRCGARVSVDRLDEAVAVLLRLSEYSRAEWQSVRSAASRLGGTENAKSSMSEYRAIWNQVLQRATRLSSWN